MTTAVEEKSAAARAGSALVVTVAVTALVIWLFGDAAYLWVKAIHVIAIISWMAGLLYLPRLFIYHCDAPKGSVQSETFKVMESRLLNIIMTPAMVISWVLGLWLAYQAGFFSSRLVARQTCSCNCTNGRARIFLRFRPPLPPGRAMKSRRVTGGS